MDSTDRFTPVSADLFDVKDIIDNRQLLTSCTAAILLSFSLSYIVKDATDIFGLVTANTLITNRYVWNLITACFYETNPLKVFVDITLLLVGTRLTAVPSIEQFGLYFAFNVLACTIGTSAYLFVSFFATGKEELLITPHYGFGGVLMAVLMFARQQLRGVSIHSSIPRITYHNFPLIVISAKLILWIFLIETLSMDIYFSVIGFFFSWSYLRFYYRYQEHEPLGDSAEDFSFVAMFPEPLHIIMIPLSTAFYNLVALVGIYPQLEVTERRQYHHLRYVSCLEINAALPYNHQLILCCDNL